MQRKIAITWRHVAVPKGTVCLLAFQSGSERQYSLTAESVEGTALSLQQQNIC